MRSILYAVVGLAAACGASREDSGPSVSAGDAGTSGCLSSNECPTGFVCNEFGSCEAPTMTSDGGVTAPPEVEYTFGAPISSQRYVYVAMTDQNELARIDGQTLAVTATPVGKAPRDVATIPGSDGAVVRDSTNGTATIVRPAAGGDIVHVLATLPDLNRLDVDPTGRYAVIWFDLAKRIANGGIGGVGSFQDVTVVSLATGGEKAVDLTVGFEPRAVQFDATGTHAFVITETGVSVIDLAGATEGTPAIVPPIAVADPSIPASDLEVQIVATGSFAVVRQAGISALRVVSLRAADAGHAWTIPLASAATDIDLAPDGSRVYAVERDAKLLAIIDVPADAIDPHGVQTIDLSDAAIGSLTVSPDGARALLFTNATLDERVTMVSLDKPGFPHVTWPLEKSVRAVAISPSSDTALVLHAKIPGDPSTATSTDDFIDKSYGYSLVDLSSGFAKLEITAVDPSSFAYAPDGSKLYVGLDGGDDPLATRSVQVVATHTGVVKTDPLGSPPSAIGILPGASQAFIAQRHPLGRVSFVQLVTDAMRTVTGFDLNGHVVD